MNRIKAKRFINDLTQDQLSVLTGIQRSKISRIENGYITPSKEEKKLFAKALKSKPEEIFTEN